MCAPILCRHVTDEQGGEIASAPTSLSDADPATWASVVRDLIRGGYKTVWKLIDRERVGIAFAFFILTVLSAVTLILAVKLPSGEVGAVLKGLITLLGQQWAVAALGVSVFANVFQAWNRKQLGVIMQREIDRQASEKRELQLLLVPQLQGRTSRPLPALDQANDD